MVRLGLILAALSLVGVSAAQDSFLHGGDVSEIPEVEANGGHFTYQGQVQDPFVIMKEAGWNFVRFRVWNDPSHTGGHGYCDKAHTLDMAKRAAAQGLKISIDFHYSDWWADPGKQWAPAAWKDMKFEDATKAIYDYTKDVIGSLVAQGTPPYMVQCGNEILSGMCWPFARLNGEDPEPWNHLGKLLKAGFKAVHDAQGPNHIITMIHIDRGGDNKGAIWWFDHINKEHVKFDTIGLSYYPFYHGTLEAMTANVDDLAKRYHKDIYIVETAYPWGVGNWPNAKRGLIDAYPATPEGQADYLKKVIEIIHEIPDGRGKGILYWAPTWISTTNGGGWGYNATFGAKGEALPAVDVLGGK